MIDKCSKLNLLPNYKIAFSMYSIVVIIENIKTGMIISNGFVHSVRDHPLYLLVVFLSRSLTYHIFECFLIFL